MTPPYKATAKTVQVTFREKSLMFPPPELATKAGKDEASTED